MIQTAFKASLDPKNFEGVIERHGQYVRWIRRQNCYCMTDFGNPNPRCNACNGRGWISDLQTRLQVENESVKHSKKIIFPEYKNLSQIYRVYRDSKDYLLSDITIFKNDCVKWIGVDGEGFDILLPHQELKMDYEYSLENSLDNYTDVTYLGNGLLKLNNFRFEGKYDYEILNVIKVENHTIHYDPEPPNDPLPTERQVIGFTGKYIYFEDDGQELDTDEWDISVTYAKPYIFGILGITMQMKQEDSWVHPEGDAIAIVPYNIQIGEGDVITALVLETRGNQNFTYRSGQNEYEINQFDVNRIINIEDKSSYEFKEDIDFIITKRNILKFLDGGIKPDGAFSVLFLYHPSFTVLPDIPNLRTPENKKFPKKVSVKLWGATNTETNLNLGRKLVR